MCAIQHAMIFAWLTYTQQLMKNAHAGCVGECRWKVRENELDGFLLTMLHHLVKMSLLYRPHRSLYVFVAYFDYIKHLSPTISYLITFIIIVITAHYFRFSLQTLHALIPQIVPVILTCCHIWCTGSMPWYIPSESVFFSSFLQFFSLHLFISPHALV